MTGAEPVVKLRTLSIDVLQNLLVSLDVQTSYENGVLRSMEFYADWHKQ